MHSKNLNNIFSGLELKTVFVKVLLVITIVVNLYCVFGNWNKELDEPHVFRQSQTAISTYYLVNEKFTLNYITPVFGPPYTIPIEFPIYQFLVAGVYWVSPFTLDQSGRIISIVCLWATFLVWYLTLVIRLKIEITAAILCISFSLINPTLLFWPSTFLPETCNILFSSLWLFLYLTWNKYPTTKNYILMLLIGIIAALMKITTFINWAILGYALAIFFKNSLPLNRKYVFHIFSFMLPVLICLIWNQYTDFLKQSNVFAKYLSSANHLFGWIIWWDWGRADIVVWRRIFEYSMFLIKIHLPLLFLYKLNYWKLSVVLGIVFWTGPLFFTHLYYHHEYYFVVGSIFLSTSLGLIVFSLFKNKNIYISVLGLFCIVVVMYLNLYKYKHYYRNKVTQINTAIPPIINLIKENIHGNAPVVIFGDDWNPMIPYYTHKKAIMIKSEWLNPSNYQAFYKLLKSAKPKAIICIGNKINKFEYAINVANILKIDTIPSYRHDIWPYCYVYNKVKN